MLCWPKLLRDRWCDFEKGDVLVLTILLNQGGRRGRLWRAGFSSQRNNEIETPDTRFNQAPLAALRLDISSNILQQPSKAISNWWMRRVFLGQLSSSPPPPSVYTLHGEVKAATLEKIETRTCFETGFWLVSALFVFFAFSMCFFFCFLFPHTKPRSLRLLFPLTNNHVVRTKPQSISKSRSVAFAFAFTKWRCRTWSGWTNWNEGEPEKVKRCRVHFGKKKATWVQTVMVVQVGSATLPLPPPSLFHSEAVYTAAVRE